MNLNPPKSVRQRLTLNPTSIISNHQRLLESHPPPFPPNTYVIVERTLFPVTYENFKPIKLGVVIEEQHQMCRLWWGKRKCAKSIFLGFSKCRPKLEVGGGRN